jgi:2-methylcitrate dehydratase PrpD
MNTAVAASATRTLSEFVVAAEKRAMPADLFDLARQCVLDTFGAMLIGATKPWSRMTAAFSLGEGGCVGGPSTVVGATGGTAPQMAALANGMMAHGFEIDDVHDESLTHPGAVVVPAAMAVAEQTGASGAEFIMAVILGYELNGRAGLGVGAVAHMLGGFYPTGTSGVFGAATAAARLLGADCERMTHTLGLAGSFASGIVEFADSGGMVKRLHAGRAAEGGVTAAYLAMKGLTGPTTVLEGRHGFCRVFSSAPALERLLDGLGEDYKIRQTTVKPYACCSDIHPIIEALLDIKATYRFDPHDVRDILVEAPSKVVELNDIDGTASMMAAQYSVPFTAAIVLLRDIRDPAIYRESTLQDAELASFQPKVALRRDAEFDRLFPKLIAARVTVTLGDGRTLTGTNRGAAGSIHHPLSKAQVEDKFMRLADPILAPGRASEIVRLVEIVEDLPDIGALTALLRFDMDRECPAPSCGETAAVLP